ncbi:CPBP family intramembrane glutamic endopeptidase [Lacinutrix jangbogonensis]|jgi:hypothetical protein|uniref:CPBP family intramembrane glutamic endopeptidase n=1 Tax=Lacinutrix jangbogonensis TaxID=1469557 RepID=UPI00053E06AF|nr:CPBP family intramembrane glutamic endopeptidase [Lacinutrix jangbogonensis]
MKKTYLNLITLLALYLSCLLLTFPLNKLLLDYDISELKSRFISQIIVLIPLLIALFFLIKKFDLKTFNGIDKGLNIGKSKFLLFPLLFLIYIVYNNFYNISSIESSELLLIIVMVLLVGFTEELFFRGILLPFFIFKLKTKKHFLLSSILLSSLVFGIIHLLNLINNSSTIVGVTIQVIFAVCIGCFFSGLILRTNSIIIPSLFHAIINFKAWVGQVTYKSKEPIEYTEEFLSTMPEIPEPTIWNSLINELPYFLLLLLLGCLILWKIDEQKILKKLNPKSTTGNTV